MWDVRRPLFRPPLMSLLSARPRSLLRTPTFLDGAFSQPLAALASGADSTRSALVAGTRGGDEPPEVGGRWPPVSHEVAFSPGPPRVVLVRGCWSGAGPGSAGPAGAAAVLYTCRGIHRPRAKGPGAVRIRDAKDWSVRP